MKRFYPLFCEIVSFIESKKLNYFKTIKNSYIHYVICKVCKLKKLNKSYSLDELIILKKDLENNDAIDLEYLQSNIGEKLLKKLKTCFFDVLSNLRLGSFSLTDKGIDFLSLFYFKNLRNLYLNNCNLSSNGLKNLSKWDIKLLSQLDLSDNFIRDDGILYLCDMNCKNLKIINFSYNCLGRSENKSNLEEHLKSMNHSLYSQIVVKNIDKPMGTSLIELLNICIEKNVFDTLELINLKGSVMQNTILKDLKIKNAILISSYDD